MPQTDTLTDAPVEDVLEPTPSSLAGQLVKAHDPRVPVSLEQLAALAGGLQVIEQRATILHTGRVKSMRETEPEDWTGYMRRDGRVVCYLSDAGCERARAIWGINIHDVSPAERVAAPDGQAFAILVRGHATSSLTKETVENMLGARSSDEDFCRDKTGVQLLVAVEKAARANLDGNCCRELMGLKNVPLETLIAAWEGTGKNADYITKGRGFGTQDERLGGTKPGAPKVDPPCCTVCKDDAGNPLPLLYRPGKGENKAFYGCRNWDKHRQVKVTVDAAAWEKQALKAQRDKEADAKAQADEAARQPGEEG